MAIEEITNYIHVSNRIASSGQPKEFEFKDIAQAGFEVVINLAMPNSENAIPEEGYIVTARKMQYIHIPVLFDAPTPVNIRDFISVMNAYNDKKVWVHCVVNYRASAFLFLYMKLVKNSTTEEARKVILESWKPNDVWMRFMEISKDEISS
ncbi:MAG: protein tyrosine phosphatase family protein [Candidatus Thiodiazotropha sp. DIVDIV]